MSFGLKKFGLLFFVWTAFALLFALQGFAGNIYLGQNSSFWLLLAVWLIASYGWMMLTPAVLYLAEKFPIERRRFFPNLAVHLAAAIVLAVLHLSIIVVFRQALLGDPARNFMFGATFQRLFLSNFNFDFLIYWIIVGALHLWRVNRRFVERERETARLALSTSQLETKLARAQLDALRMQLNPHFLFNTLNSISVLIGDDAKAADKMLVNLSELLRVALKNENAQEVVLKEELELLRSYLEIEQARFENRLTVDFLIDDDTLAAKVPSLILQPLVENAIRHGIAPQAGRGRITIESRRVNDFIELKVSDSGNGDEKTPPAASHGIGLKNTRERLEKLYGARHEFEISERGALGGFSVKIKIPYHERQARKP